MIDIRSLNTSRINLILDFLPEEHTASRETLSAALREYSRENDTYFRRVKAEETTDDAFVGKLISEFGGKFRDNTLVNTQMCVNIAIFWSPDGGTVGLEKLEAIISEIKQTNSERYRGDWQFYLFVCANTDRDNTRSVFRQLGKISDSDIFIDVICENSFQSNITQMEAAVVFIFAIGRASIQSIFADNETRRICFMFEQRYAVPRLADKVSKPSALCLTERNYDRARWKSELEKFADKLFDKSKDVKNMRDSLPGFDVDSIPVPKRFTGISGMFSGKSAEFREFLGSVSDSFTDSLEKWWTEKADSLCASAIDEKLLVNWYEDVSEDRLATPFAGFDSLLGSGATVLDLDEYANDIQPGQAALKLRDRLFDGMTPGGDIHAKLKNRVGAIADDLDVKKWMKSILAKKLKERLDHAIAGQGLDFDSLLKRIRARCERTKTRIDREVYQSEDDFIRGVENSSCAAHIPYPINPTFIFGKRVLKFYYCDTDEYGAPCSDNVRDYFKKGPSFVDSLLRKEEPCVCVSIVSCRKEIFGS